MPIERLKSCPQELWLGSSGYSSEGICYYMSEYIEGSIWSSHTVSSFSAACSAASNSVPATIIKAAKAKNLQQKGGEAHGTAQDALSNYLDFNTPLAANSVYRIALWFGETASAPTGPNNCNHEAIVITGANSDAVLFEPNFGFYQVSSTTETNRGAIESCIQGLYGAESHAENFKYYRKRRLT